MDAAAAPDVATSTTRPCDWRLDTAATDGPRSGTVVTSRRPDTAMAAAEPPEVGADDATDSAEGGRGETSGAPLGCCVASDPGVTPEGSTFGVLRPGSGSSTDDAEAPCVGCVAGGADTGLEEGGAGAGGACGAGGAEVTTLGAVTAAAGDAGRVLDATLPAAGGVGATAVGAPSAAPAATGGAAGDAGTVDVGAAITGAAGAGSGAPAGAGGTIGRDGRNRSGSRYPCSCDATRIPRCT
jgi:hypothetical protein